MTTSLDDLLPKAEDCMKKIAAVEAEKASEYVRKQQAADAEKRALLERLSHPSGVSDEERAAIGKKGLELGDHQVFEIGGGYAPSIGSAFDCPSDERCRDVVPVA